MLSTCSHHRICDPELPSDVHGTTTETAMIPFIGPVAEAIATHRCAPHQPPQLQQRRRMSQRLLKALLSKVNWPWPDLRSPTWGRLFREYVCSTYQAQWLLSIPAVVQCLQRPYPDYWLDILRAVAAPPMGGAPPSAHFFPLDRLCGVSSPSNTLLLVGGDPSRLPAELMSGELTADISTSQETPAFFDVTLRLQSLHRSTPSAGQDHVLPSAVPIPVLLLAFSMCEQTGSIVLAQLTPLLWHDVPADKVLSGQHQRTTIIVQNDTTLRRKVQLLCPPAKRRRNAAMTDKEERGEKELAGIRSRTNKAQVVDRDDRGDGGFFLQLHLPTTARRGGRETTPGESPSFLFPLVVLDESAASPLLAIQSNYDSSFWTVSCSSSHFCPRYGTLSYVVSTLVLAEAYPSLMVSLRTHYQQLLKRRTLLSDDDEAVKLLLHTVDPVTLGAFHSLLRDLVLSCYVSNVSVSDRETLLEEVLQPSHVATHVEECLNSVRECMQRYCKDVNVDEVTFPVSLEFSHLQRVTGRYLWTMAGEGVPSSFRSLLTRMHYEDPTPSSQCIDAQRVTAAVEVLCPESHLRSEFLFTKDSPLSMETAATPELRVGRHTAAFTTRSDERPLGTRAGSCTVTSEHLAQHCTDVILRSQDGADVPTQVLRAAHSLLIPAVVHSAMAAEILKSS